MKEKLQIIENWYKKLLFDSAYDKLFYTHLNHIDVSDLTDFLSYDYKKNSPQKNLLACLYFCENLQKRYEEKGIEKSILMDSLQDLVLWNKSYYDVHGDIGLTEFLWVARTFLMKIFRLGRLQFSMFQSGFDIEELNVKIGDPILEVHIPSGGPLRYDECASSFESAKAFFKKYYPDFPQEWCSCHSWLLDETMLPILGENSNVAKFQTFFKKVKRNASDSVLKYTFLWNTTRENVKDCQPLSGFAKRLKEKALLGETFYEVIGIRKL